MLLSHNPVGKNCLAPKEDFYIVTLVAVGDGCALNDRSFVLHVLARDWECARDKAMRVFRQTLEGRVATIWAWSTELR